MKIQHLKMVPGQKNKSWNIISIQCETTNMPDENLTEEIWWDLSYTFGFNIDEEKN